MKRIVLLTLVASTGFACDSKTTEEKQQEALAEQAEVQKKKLAEQAAKLEKDLDALEKQQGEQQEQLAEVTKDDGEGETPSDAKPSKPLLDMSLAELEQEAKNIEGGNGPDQTFDVTAGTLKNEALRRAALLLVLSMHAEDHDAFASLVPDGGMEWVPEQPAKPQTLNLEQVKEGLKKPGYFGLLTPGDVESVKGTFWSVTPDEKNEVIAIAGGGVYTHAELKLTDDEKRAVLARIVYVEPQD
jgi:hypothetical protein